MTGRRRRPSGGSHHDSTGSSPAPRRHDTATHGDSPESTRRNRDQGVSGGHGVGANLDTLDSMSGKLDATRGKVEGVGKSVRGVNVGPKTMGLIGSGFAGAAESHLRTAEQHVTRTTRAVEQAQAGTRGTTQAYRTTDATSAANLAAIETPTQTPKKPSSTTPQSSTPTPTRGGDQTGTPSQPRSISGTLDDGGTPPSPPPPPPPPPPGPRRRPPIQHTDPSGKTIRTDKLQHPDAQLLDQSLLDQAAKNPNRMNDALAPGADMNHPAVQAIVPNTYHRDGFDANGQPMTRAQWDAQYWPNGTYDTHGGRDLTWPDPQRHPEGFSSPQDRNPSVLQPGQQIDRFGPGFGRFASPTDTPFPERGLPPDNLYDMRDPAKPGVNPNGPAPSYHRYEVIKPIPVWEGPIAPAMGQPGGGVQYYTPRAIIDLVNAGYLREVPL